MQRETKKLVYKVAGGLSGSETLQQLVDGAVKKFHAVDSRLELLGEDGSEVRFINFVREHRNVTFGALHKVAKGAAQHVINMDGKGDSWEMVTMSAKSEKQPHREFIEGTLFFGIWKNHVVLHQTTACRADQFENYLTWLAAKVAGDGEPPGQKSVLVSLDDPVPKHLREKQGQAVKHITVAGTLQSKAVEQKTVEKKGHASTQSTAFNFTPTGGAWDGIRSILQSMGIGMNDDFLLSNALEERDVRVRLELSCTKKKSQSSAGEVLGKLGHALRNSDGDFYKVELTDGTIITAKEIKIERTYRVECAERLPSLESMFKCMMEFFEELVATQDLIEEAGFGNTK